MKHWVKKSLLTAARLLAVGLLLGWLYGWASPKVYPTESKLGFGYGCLHGALMPMALPSLVMGHDVEIFAPNHSGRLQARIHHRDQHLWLGVLRLGILVAEEAGGGELICDRL